MRLCVNLQVHAQDWGQIIEGAARVIIENSQRQQGGSRWNGDEVIERLPRSGKNRRYLDERPARATKPAKTRPTPEQSAAREAEQEKRRQANLAAKAEADAKSTELRDVQMRPAQLNFSAGPPDGRPGTKTTKAIKAFQASIGPPETGILTPTEKLILVNAKDGTSNPNAVRQALKPLDAGSATTNVVADSSTLPPPTSTLPAATSSLPEPVPMAGTN